MKSESKLRQNLRAYGICNEDDFKTLETQMDDDQKKIVETATAREQIQLVLMQLAAAAGMNTKKPGRFVHP